MAETKQTKTLNETGDPLLKDSFKETRDRYFPGGYGESLLSAKNS